MNASFRSLEGLAVFLAGAGMGAALARSLPYSGWGLAGGAGGILTGTGQSAPVAASLGRMQALLGEIRSLLAPQSGGSAPAAASKEHAGESADADEAGAPSAAEGLLGRDAWRTPDRIGYGESGENPVTAGLLTLSAAAAGAAAVHAAIRKGGGAAAWPALAGFLAAGAWAAWGDRLRATGSVRRKVTALRPGRDRDRGRGGKGSRSDRAAAP